LRTFEEIVGIFQDAHRPKTANSSNQVRTFDQGCALDPVPLTRKVAQPRVSALGGLLRSSLIHVE
jgi:hypothetical protein